MSLKITLKPNERMIIGGAVITNGGAKSTIIIENKVPVLRSKDIMSERDANTPTRRIYFAIQLMYIDEENETAHHDHYWSLVRELLQAAPSMLPMLDQIGDFVVRKKYYQAMKKAKKLIDHEAELLPSSPA